MLIHSSLGLGLVALGLGLIALGLGLGLDLVASASYTSGLINIPIQAPLGELPPNFGNPP